MECRNCGDPVDPRRVELGYDYCLRDECQERCLKPVVLAAVGVNKAADYYMKAEEVVPPPPPPGAGLSIDGDDSDPSLPVRSRRPANPTATAAATAKNPAAQRPKTTRQQLEEVAAALDAALERGYQRFCRGEMTARELDQQRDRLTRAFNSRVMAENIRYRSLLRPLKPPR